MTIGQLLQVVCQFNEFVFVLSKDIITDSQIRGDRSRDPFGIPIDKEPSHGGKESVLLFGKLRRFAHKDINQAKLERLIKCLS